jgi:hypothetical protein
MFVIFFQPMHLSLRSFTKSSTPLDFGIHIPELLVHADILIYIPITERLSVWVLFTESRLIRLW